MGVATLLLACSSSTGSSSTASGGRAGAGSSAGGAGLGGAGAGAAAGGAATTGGAGATTGAAAGAGSAGAAGSASGPIQASDLWPLAVGNTWSSTASVDDPTCDPDAMEVVGFELHEGRMAYRLTLSCTSDDLWVNVEGGSVYQFLGGAWKPSMAMPVEEGAVWDWDASYKFAWTKVASVTVKAGTFTDCWRRIDPKSDQAATRVYCPGVGGVLFERGAVRSELTAYHVGP